MKPFIKILLISLLIFQFSHPCRAQNKSPQSTLEMFIETIRSMQFPVTDQAQHDVLTAKADQFLDLDAVGQKAIADHWNEMSPDQQKSFLDLFKKLIRKTAYPRSHDFLGNLKVTYPEIQTDATGTTIKSIVHQSGEGVDAEIIYHLTQKKEEWKVDDVILDDVSIVEDLKYQFDKILKDSSFDGLLAKMKEKLAA